MSKLSDFFGGFGSGGGVAGLPIKIVNSNETIGTNLSVGIDTSQGSVEVTLPADPLPGDRLFFFDAAKTWGENPAIIHVNGNRVEFDVIQTSSYVLKRRAGVHEIVFISDSVGWKDISVYNTAVDPLWFGGTTAGEDIVIDIQHLFDELSVSHELVLEIDESGEWEVDRSGYYCILGAGGTGGVGNTDPRRGYAGGDTTIYLNSLPIFLCKGGRGNSQREVSEEPFHVPSEARRLEDSLGAVTQIGSPVLYKKQIDSVLSRSEYLYAQNIGIDVIPHRVPGVRRSSSSGYSETLEPASFLSKLKIGDVVAASLGAGGTYGGNVAGSRTGNSGKVAIYYLGEHHGL